MSKNITLLGQNYLNVPAVELPQTGGGIATFVDTSDATASVTQILNGYTAYVNGEKITGTASSGSAGSEPEPLDVNFFDYDGTLLYVYSKADFLALDILPSLPTHTGLTAYNWNWTLVDAKEYVQKYGILEIGATYKTDDGSTRLYFDIYDNTVLDTAVRLKASIANDVTIDWGDNNTTTISGTSYTNSSHTYAEPGRYVVKITATNGTVSFGGGTGVNILGAWTTSNKRRLNCCKNIEFGNNVLALETHVFQALNALETIVLPYNLISIGNYAFDSSSWGLRALVFPSGFTTLSTTNNTIYVKKCLCLPKSISGYINGAGNVWQYQVSMPENCIVTWNNVVTKIEKIIIPSGIDNIPANAYRYSHLTRYIEIGKDVTSIGATSFMECPASEIHLRPAIPPTLNNTNAFANWLQSSAVFYVPYSADHSILDAYKTATNWSTWESKMQEEPQ